VHELSIAMSIAELAEEEADRRGGVHVNAIHLKVGALSGIVEDALRASFEMVVFESSLKDSRLVIEKVPVAVYCPVCQEPRRLVSIQSFSCPVCGTATPEVIEGKELELVALEIDG
jgi:hydrogenase nickel incorporation protein HypA/HybF